jgi:hypothetical protein
MAHRPNKNPKAIKLIKENKKNICHLGLGKESF